MDLCNLLFAHRGVFDQENTPENSLKAIEKAVGFHVPVEIDVCLTKDKKLIVFHDNNLKRMTGKNLYVEDLTLEEIGKFFLGSSLEVIPTLDEVLELVNGEVLLNIEIKITFDRDEICKILYDKLENYQGDIILQSFSPSIVRTLKKMGQYPVGLLITYMPTNKFYSYLMSSLFYIQYCNPDFLSINKKIIKNKRIQRYRKHYPIFVWTMVSRNEYYEYLDYADSFICNNLPY